MSKIKRREIKSIDLNTIQNKHILPSIKNPNNKKSTKIKVIRNIEKINTHEEPSFNFPEIDSVQRGQNDNGLNTSIHLNNDDETAENVVVDTKQQNIFNIDEKLLDSRMDEANLDLNDS